jgi:polar amino acid transport system substrate-binding protein
MSRYRLRRVFLILAGLALPLWASAGCSRPIRVPASPSGQAVIKQGGQIVGLIPEVMNQIGARIGCTFVWTPVARMRLESMFQTGAADILITAVKVERRDRDGIFIPLLDTRATLISIKSDRAPVRSMQELLARRELRVALVRGFDYGPAYQAMLTTLASQGRLYLQPHPGKVARMLADGMADVTVITGISFAGGLLTVPHADIAFDSIRSEPLADLPWQRSGFYLSKTALGDADRRLLEQALTESSRNGLWWQAFKRYYPAAILDASARPLEPPR